MRSLLPALEEIRAGGDRVLRQTIKPIVDMVRNRGKLNSPDPDVRRLQRPMILGVVEGSLLFRGLKGH